MGGDGRCDSPGFCAKYGTYSCMDLKTNNILDLQLVQVHALHVCLVKSWIMPLLFLQLMNEVRNSGAMELEGFKRCLNNLNTHGVQLKELITDRYVQIKKYMREEQSDIQHHFACGMLPKVFQLLCFNTYNHHFQYVLLQSYHGMCLKIVFYHYF